MVRTTHPRRTMQRTGTLASFNLTHDIKVIDAATERATNSRGDNFVFLFKKVIS
jgi:hypothetical protein